MTMHPELEEAFDAGLSMEEVFELFTEHHSGQMEERIETDYSDFEKLGHNDCTFWENWKPLLLRVQYSAVRFYWPVDKPFRSIHKALTREIISWLCDSKRRSNVYLISETSTPTRRTNHNTRAHLFGNVCYDAQRFGLPTRNSILGFWCGIDLLVVQLATCYTPYRRILARKLVDNPRILKLSRRTRFKKLILDPWQALRESHPQYIISPPVIVLHWDPKFLDEELLRSILEFGSSPHSSSLLWIISIDANLKLPTQDLLHPFVLFQYYRLPIRYKEGPADTALILHHRFSALRRRHKEMFDTNEVWPSEEQMSQLIRVVAGVFDTVEVIIQFIDWKDDGGPKAHLETFLAYMSDSPSPSDERRYCALDHFYTLALSSIPPHLLSVFKQAFSNVHYADYPLQFAELELVCLFSLGKDILLAVLPHVYRLVMVRTFLDGNPWIRRFLEDATRSGQFYTPPSESRLCVFQASLHILRHASNPSAILKVAVHGTQASAGRYCSVIDRLRQSASYELCYTGTALASDQPPSLVLASLRHFDFRCLAHTCDKIHLSSFMKFLKVLYLERGDLPGIVRIEPVGLLDRQFIDKCEGLAESLDLEKMRLPRDSEEHKEWVLFHVKNPKYVLLGFGDETVLAVLATRDRGVYGVNIYTSAMLDCM